MQTNTFGTRGEIIAANFLINKGYKILERNYKNNLGEIDIIAKDGNTLVFVEVKTRISKAFGDPLEAITYKKQEKIHKVATIYLMKKHLINSDYRFDAISVLGEGDDEINHIENAF